MSNFLTDSARQMCSSTIFVSMTADATLSARERFAVFVEFPCWIDVSLRCLFSHWRPLVCWRLKFFWFWRRFCRLRPMRLYLVYLEVEVLLGLVFQKCGKESLHRVHLVMKVCVLFLKLDHSCGSFRVLDVVDIRRLFVLQHLIQIFCSRLCIQVVFVLLVEEAANSWRDVTVEGFSN